MKSYSSREVIQMLKADGWIEVSVVGSHQRSNILIRTSREKHWTALKDSRG